MLDCLPGLTKEFTPSPSFHTSLSPEIVDKPRKTPETIHFVLVDTLLLVGITPFTLVFACVKHLSTSRHRQLNNHQTQFCLILEF
jgi:hypothetical protein